MKNRYTPKNEIHRKILILIITLFTLWNSANYISYNFGYDNNSYNNEDFSLILPEDQIPSELSSLTLELSSPTSELSSSPSSISSSSSSSSPYISSLPTLLQDCNDKCKFLFPYFLPEQETKANLHLRSYVQLAESLNRILVIPNVGLSRIRACMPFPASFYYNLDSLQTMFPNSKFVTQDQYELWLDYQPNHNKIIGEHLSLNRFLELNDDDNLEESEIKMITKKLLYKNFTITNSNPEYEKRRKGFKKYKTCPYDFKIDIKTLKEVRLYNEGILNVAAKYRSEFSEFLAEFLRSDSQVIVIYTTVRQSLFPEMFYPIPYADHILKESSKIINRLESSYIAIHWRMEQASAKNLPNCAKGLVRKINQIRNITGIKNVYLATDFPITHYNDGSLNTNNLQNIRTQSDTFGGITLHHIKAMDILTSSIKGIKTWQSLNAFEYSEYNADEEKSLLFNELSGPGIQGILDKLNCINSNYFLSGPKDCCRIQSGFTNQIANTRWDLLNKGNKKMLNTLTRW